MLADGQTITSRYPFRSFRSACRRESIVHNGFEEIELRLKIWQAGEAVLRRKARSLTKDEILSRDTQELIESMRQTMRDAPGVGLAAPQVGVGIQLVVIEDPAEVIQALSPGQARERERRPVPFHVVINPKLRPAPDQTVEFFEGCLSVAGFTAIVPRSRRVRVECLNEKAKPVTIDAEGWYARILQHEIDHLNGVLYVDRMRSRSLSTQDNHGRYWKDKPVAEFWQETGSD
jgi:peptide deformylase